MKRDYLISFIFSPAKLVQVFFLFIPNYVLQASNWVVLPVISEGVKPHLVQTGPNLYSDTEKNNWAIAHVIQNTLFIGGVKNIIHQETLKRSYRKLNLNSKMHLDINQLKGIARESDAQKLLVSRIRYTGNQYILTSKVYYASSHNLTDTIQTKSHDIWKLIDLHLKQRFNYYSLNRVISLPKKQIILFLFDASGSGFYEIKALKKMLHNYRSYRQANIGICAVHGDGKISFLKTGLSQKRVLDFLSKLLPRGGDRFFRGVFSGLNCLKKIFPKIIDKNTKVKIVITASGVPKSIHNKRRVKLFLRRLAQKSEILTVGSANLKPSERTFWVDAMQEISFSGAK